MMRYFLGTILKSEPLYYNIQISVDKDCTYDTKQHESPTITFYKDSLYVLTFITEGEWRLNFNNYGGLEIRKPIETTNLYLYEIVFFEICDGTFPISEPTLVVKDEVTFTFTPIPVYE